MTAPRSFLYTGTVAHRRFGPKTHALRYRMFMALLDLDELDALHGTLRLFSRNRFNLFSFYDRDHTACDASDPETGRALRAQVEAQLAKAGIDLDGGTITLLSLPRILGYAFNPLSVYFCHGPAGQDGARVQGGPSGQDGASGHADASGQLLALLYEVRNTFGQRHTYLIPVMPQTDEAAIRQSCQKVFYVSPFMDMDMTYAFRVVPPGETLSIAVDGLKGEDRIIATAFAGQRHPLTDGQLLRAFLGHPFLSLAVVAGIHWEALKLWLKGVGLRARPAPPIHSVSIVSPKET